MAFRIKTHFRRSENCRINYGKNFRVSPCNKNEWIFSDSGGSFYNRGKFTLIHLIGNCNCLHLKNGYPPDPMQVVDFLFSSEITRNKSSLSIEKGEIKIKEIRNLQGERQINLQLLPKGD